MAERMIEANGVELCTEPFGDPADPPLLLIMGMSSSMLWWDDEFCSLLAARDRFVIRYDHRDTGRSVSYEPGRPGYSSPDLIADAAGVLDAYGLLAAHVVGTSMGGAIAQLLALDFPDRVLSLVLISSSPAVPVDRDLPSISEQYARFLAEAEVDWSDLDSVVDYVVADTRALTGPGRRFDEAGVRELVTREVDRARDPASARNHAELEGGERRGSLTSIAAPTLVIHGTADPMFEPAHGEALAAEIPGARLLTLEGAGHALHRADWEPVAEAIVEHTKVEVI